MEAERFNVFEKSRIIANDFVEFAFIGNSITLHGPSRDIGWINNNGMAASCLENDYCHILLRKLNVNICNTFIGNFSELERSDCLNEKFPDELRILFEKKPNVTIIQLGDNVQDDVQLQFFYNNLIQLALSARMSSKRVFFISTWWESPGKDVLIKKVSDSINATYIHIGDLFKSPSNLDNKYKEYDHIGVNNHPRNWAMAEISRRLLCHLN